MILHRHLHFYFYTPVESHSRKVLQKKLNFTFNTYTWIVLMQTWNDARVSHFWPRAHGCEWPMDLYDCFSL